ncbi:MAG: glutaredoxin family protein [Anaerolineae bacterium]|nr:glutaredoxin family protein [Anaerolineae bacterium]
MEKSSPEFVVYGTGWCPDVARTRRYLDKHDVAYTYRDIDEEPEAMATLLELRGKAWVVPTLVFEDGTILDDPSVRDLADLLGSPKR